MYHTRWIRWDNPFTGSLGSFLARMGKEAAAKQGASAELAGQLYLSASGDLLLSVPNALVRGAFAALSAPGASLAVDSDGSLRAHLLVMRKKELDSIPGGEKAVTERGRTFKYTLGPLRESSPEGGMLSDISKVYYLEARSPELKELRRSYGLTPAPWGDSFRIPIAFRRKGVLGRNETSKVAGKIGRTLSILLEIMPWTCS